MKSLPFQLVAICIAAMAMTAPAALAQNMVLNPGFELDQLAGVNPPTDWSSTGNSVYNWGTQSAATTNALAHSGAWSVLLTVTGGEASGFPDAIYQSIAVVAGDTYNVSVWFYKSQNTRTSLRLAPNDPLLSNVYIAEDAAGSGHVNNWYQLAGTWTAPAGATSVDLRLYAWQESDFTNGSASTVTYFDDVSLSLPTVPEPGSLVVLVVGLAALAIGLRLRRSK